MNKTLYFNFILFLISGNTLMAQVEFQQANSNVVKWMNYNEKLQRETKGNIPSPFQSVEILVQKYLREPGIVLDVGCETGKNSACLIKNGHQVVLLDIAPNAIDYTIENLRKNGLDYGIQDSIVSSIEELPANYGPFKAVVGTYAFSFIPPHLFEEAMKENVFNRIESNGYFAGGFFGEQHAWAEKPNLSFLSIPEIKTLFSSRGFSILEIDQQINETPTVSNETIKFHTIHIIAHKILKLEPENIHD